MLTASLSVTLLAALAGFSVRPRGLRAQGVRSLRVSEGRRFRAHARGRSRRTRQVSRGTLRPENGPGVTATPGPPRPVARPPRGPRA